MANKSYDPEKDFEVPDHQKNLDLASEAELEKLRKKYSTYEDEAEDRAVDSGENPDNLQRHGMGRKLRLQDEANEAKKDAELQNKLSSAWSNATAQTNNDQDNQTLYKPGGDKNKGKFSGYFSGLSRQKKLLLAGGASMSAFIILFLTLFGFLNFFKLDNLMSNVTIKSFARFNAAADDRSDKWIRAYFMLRLTRLEGTGNYDPDSEYFRAYRVDTNNPIKDWYNTLRTSNFEADLQKKGIAFVNRDTPDGVRFQVLSINNGETIMGLDLADVEGGNLAEKLRNNPELVRKVDMDVNLRNAGSSREARKIIKEVVHENTRFYQVLQRRMYRKAIANMTGVKSWRFFETTRDNIQNTKVDIRNRVVAKAFPETTRAGKFVNCLFGITFCTGSSDTSDPQYRASTATLRGDTGTRDCDGASNDCTPDYRQVDASGNQLYDEPDPNDPDSVRTPRPDVTAEKLAYEDTANALKAIVGRTGGSLVAAFSFLSWLQILSNFNTMIQTNSLSKMVMVARGVQAMALYQVMTTARDQIKSGDLSAEEHNQLMQIISNAANSEGFSKVIRGNGDPAVMEPSRERTQYCSKENQAFLANPDNEEEANQQYHYLCPEKQIGANSNARKFEETVDKYFGPLLRLAGGAFTALTQDTGILGRLVATTLSVTDWLAEKAVQGLIAFMGATGFQNSLSKIQTAMFRVMNAMVAFLGAGSIYGENGYAPSGVLFNWAVQGGAFGGEATLRDRGAGLTNNQTRAIAEGKTLTYLSEAEASLSLYERYASTDNVNSLASKSLFAVSDIEPSNLLKNLFGAGGSLFKSFGKMFSPGTEAANWDVYAASKFADIPTYDYPQECYNLDPLTMDSPLRDEAGNLSTNIFEEFRENGITGKSLADWGATPAEQWAVATDSTKFYNYLYDVVNASSFKDKPDQITLQVYNCSLLDSAVRTGIANVYGYTKDDGYPENTTPLGGNEQGDGANKSVYIIGDSLTVGMRNPGGLEQKLTANGWIVNGIQAMVGETVGSALGRMTDRQAISSSDAVMVALGTNHVGASAEAFSADIQRMVARIKSLNPDAEIIWVNAYTRNNNYDGVNNAINSQSSSLGYKVIDWRAEARANAGRYPFANDGIHHTAAGYSAKADFIVAQLGPGQRPSGGGSGGECDRDTYFPGYEEGGYSSDTEYMERNNPAPSGQGSNYGQGAAPIKYPGACRGPGSDDAYDLSYTRSDGGAYVDSTGQRFDGRGLKI